jgi:hypothetical protein
MKRLLRGLVGLALVAFLGVAPGACKRSPASACARPADGSVVACVDGVAITRAQVAQYLEEAWWVPGSATLPDARRAAVDRAIRTQLLAAEAKRRKLALPPGAPDAAASWALAYLTDEARTRGLSRDAIAHEEAAKRYADHLEQYNSVNRVDTQVAIVADGATGERVYREAVGLDEAAFGALAGKISIDEKTKGAGGALSLVAGDANDRQLMKMALTLRRPGSLGGPFLLSDGRWCVMRVKSNDVGSGKVLDDLLETAVKNSIVDERKRALADELDAKLRAAARVEIYDDALAAVPVPSAK